MYSDEIAIIIPARKGSKGIKNKNLKKLNKKPLIYYVINACLNSKINKRIFVSTDSNKIANYASSLGVEIIPRPKHLGNDKVIIDDVINHAYKFLEKSLHYNPNYFLTVQPTCPLITNLDISKALKILKKNNKTDTIISVTLEPHLFWIEKKNKLVKIYKNRVNRQQLPKMYKEIGLIIGCTNKQLKKGTRFGKNIEFLEIPNERSIDIDNLNDFKLCELIMQRNR